MRTIHLDSLPGCQPYDNCRVMRVRQSMEGLRLLDFLHALHPPMPLSDWRAWIAAGKITLNGQPVDVNDRVRSGQRFLHNMPGTIEPEVATRIGVIHEDDSILVIDKPAPMPVHPSGRFNRNTLTELLRPHYPDDSLRIAHRLDANTTGVVLLCRTPEAAGRVQPQFEARRVRKQYIAKVHGWVAWDHHECHLRIGRAGQDGNAFNTQGARLIDESGQSAHTNFEVIRRTDDGNTLVRAIPITGRTNQIRVHLWALGHSIVGDPLYLSGQRLGQQQTLAPDQPAMCLHARSLRLIHPRTNVPMEFQRPAPFE